MSQVPPRVLKTDGHYWRSLSLNEKIAFAFGFMDGYDDAEVRGLLSHPPPDSHTFDEAQNGLLTAGEFTDGADRFYADERNIRIPMHVAVTWTVMKALKATDADREAYANRMRLTFANIELSLHSL